ncbi:hypothetical protein FZO89_06355 [Luteimonas viscosa]|uniref:Uncharacterized protein n=1 Tax=Luteimonas viscosa TaxID=1132694 RepID=A0A5D4XP67_9GAMM|nr:hypothetical protein [Luteimonas viscosa]TYT25904.1 hypothetical protein FZO89_06355 [Luteimonas viscosa]
MTQSYILQMFTARVESGEVNSAELKPGKGGSWFEALAAGLGKILAARAGKMIEAQQTMERTYDSDAKQQSEEYMAAMTDFQVQSQIFSQTAQAVSTAIKSVGEGLAQVARKN